MIDPEEQKPEPEENKQEPDSPAPENPSKPGGEDAEQTPPSSPLTPPSGGPKFNPDLVGSDVDPYAHPEEPAPAEPAPKPEAPGKPPKNESEGGGRVLFEADPSELPNPLDHSGKKGAPLKIAIVLVIIIFVVAGTYFMAGPSIRKIIQKQTNHGRTGGMHKMGSPEPLKPLSVMQLEAKKAGKTVAPTQAAATTVAPVSQGSGSQVELVLTNGNIVRGKLIRQDDSGVTIDMQDIGEVPFGKVEIKEVRKLS